jgi:uncharacterized membrane protein
MPHPRSCGSRVIGDSARGRRIAAELDPPMRAIQPPASTADAPETAAVSEHVAQNIETIAHLHAEAEHRVGRHQRAIERIGAVIGRPQSLYALAAIVVLWIAFNLAAPALGLRPVDAPPFFWLQGLVSLSALLMTTVVLTTQKRQARRTAQRDHLDLQVNLIAEQKIAKLIALIEELRRDLPSVRDRRDSVAEAMIEAVDTNAMVSALERRVEPANSAPHVNETKAPIR